MARKTQQVLPSEPPTLTPERAIELIRRQLDKYPEIVKLQQCDPEVQKWQSTTESILNAAFGKPNGQHHANTDAFLNTNGGISLGESDAYYAREHLKSMANKKAALESSIEQLEILAPPIAQVAPGTYTFHAEIERVSGHLFRDGHYKQAALEAYIRVIEDVKARSDLPLDGDKLMNQALGSDGDKIPALKFNTLSTAAEFDEQRGFMYLFKGIVGLRNSKAHSNALFNDPLRAHDYLSLASLLMRVLELSTK